MFYRISGILVIVASIAVGFLLILNTKDSPKLVVFICAIGVFAGFCVLLAERVTDITVRGIGSIKAVTAQALSDAGAINALKTRVENQSATVDAVAKQAVDALKLSQEAQTQANTASERLGTVDSVLAQSKELMEQLKADADFIDVVQQAQNDDRIAYDKLRTISLDASNPYAQRASQARAVIYESHSGPMAQGDFPSPWTEGFDASKLSLEAVEFNFQGMPAQLKPNMLEYVKKRVDFSKIQRMEFFLSVMRTDASLRAVEYAGRYFTELGGLNIKALAIEYLFNWYAENRTTLE